ncbi:jg26, partial [Pararge aegeria aegeria]
IVLERLYSLTPTTFLSVSTIRMGRQFNRCTEVC